MNERTSANMYMRKGTEVPHRLRDSIRPLYASVKQAVAARDASQTAYTLGSAREEGPNQEVAPGAAVNAK